VDNVQNRDSYIDIPSSKTHTSDIWIVGGDSSLDFITSNEEFAFFHSKHEYVACFSSNNVSGTATASLLCSERVKNM
jgi:hypothetical protein